MMNRSSAKKVRTSNGAFEFVPSNRKSGRQAAFSLLELMVVIMMISILAGVTVSILRGRVDSAKWSEANAAAGTIRTAVSAFAAGRSVEIARADLVGRSLDDTAVQGALGFIESDLTGTYFAPGDYTIAAINAYGHATVQVTGSPDDAPAGIKTLSAEGNWQ